MNEYHKIETVFERDPETRFKTLIAGKYAIPEFEYLSKNKWICTEKVDGTNIRVMYNDGKLTFGGKTEQSQIPATLVNALQELMVLDKFAKTFPDGNTCLYGEGYGAKIQKGGGNYRQDQSFVLFDVKIGDVWLERHNVGDIAKKLDLETVPAIRIGRLSEMVSYVEQGFNSSWGDFTAEGIVARPQTELQTRMGKRIITKLKYKDFKKDK